MGIPVSLLGKNYDALNLLRAMTAAISLTSWLAPRLRRKLKHKVLQSHLQILHSMILIIYLLTPFTMTRSIHLFQGFRIIQTRMIDGACRNPWASTQSEAEVNFWKGVQILHTCRDQHFIPTTSFQDHFSILKASIFVLPTSPACNPSSTLAQQ